MRYQRSFLALGILLCSWSASWAGPGDPDNLTVQASATVPSLTKLFQGQVDTPAPATPVDPAPTDCGSPTQPPLMIGDPFGFRARESITLPSFATTTTRTTTTTTTVRSFTITTITSSAGLRALAALVAAPTTTVTSNSTLSSSSTTLFPNLAVTNPYATRAGFKISQNESPLPQTRVFLDFDYLDSVRGVGASFPASQAFATSSVTNTSTRRGTGFTDRITTRVDTSAATSATGGFSPRRRIDAYHDIIGFEYAVLDGIGSVGVRAPVVHQTGDQSLGLDDFGDLSVIFKGLLYSDPDRGVAISGGLMITAPTGPDINTIRGNINSTLMQPYAGFLWNSGGFFVQGFSSIILPANEHDVTLWLNSVGGGFMLYRSPAGGMLRSLTPVAEVHVTTPMNNHGPQDAIDVPNMVDITSGIEVGVGDRGLFTLGLTVPVTHERTMDLGVLAAFNMRF